MFRDGAFRIEHRPDQLRGLSGVGYHLSELKYILGLVVSAARFRSDVVVIGNGWSNLYGFGLLKLFGIKSVVTLHCTLWPPARPPRGFRRLLARLNGWFLGHGAEAILCVSHDVAEQARSLIGKRGAPISTFLPPFSRRFFEGVPAPPQSRPFQILYAGRIERDKGVFDLLEGHRASMPG